MEPVAVMTITLMPNGNVGMEAVGGNPVIHNWMLDVAKMIGLQRAVKPAQPPQPNIQVADAGLISRLPHPNVK